MKTELIAPIDLTNQDIKSILKLLLNSWSAEYALRITPLVTDEQYLNSALHWTYPQAYYSAFFSLRAVLVTLGCPTSETTSALASSTVLHKYGLYEGSGLESNFLFMLNEARTDARSMAARVATEGPLAVQAKLLAIVEAAALAHEAHIVDVLGESAFADLIGSVPSYLKEGFVWERFNKLVAQRKALAWLTSQLEEEPLC